MAEGQFNFPDLALRWHFPILAVLILAIFVSFFITRKIINLAKSSVGSATTAEPSIADTAGGDCSGCQSYLTTSNFSHVCSLALSSQVCLIRW